MTEASNRETKGPEAKLTFPPELYRKLEKIAERKKVSFAWVMRDAVEKYVAEHWPLLEEAEDEAGGE